MKRALNFGKHKRRVDDVEALQAVEGTVLKQQLKGQTRSSNVLADLRFCSITRNLEWGRQIHAKLLESGRGSSIYVAPALVKMYAKCGSMVDARRVFDSIRQPDVASWTAVLLGYAENGEGLMALDLFSEMKSHGCVPDSIAYMAALKACTSLALGQDSSGKADCLKRGKQVHSQIGCCMNLKVQNTLIDMYAKCGSMLDAHRVFDSITQPDVVSWSNLLLGYAESGEGRAALDLFLRMKSVGCLPDAVTYVAALKACTFLAQEQDSRARTECLELGRQIHSEVGCYLTPHVQSSLIGMYAKCGSMVDAQRVFDTMKRPDVVSWTAMLLGYAENGECYIALDLFSRMKSHGCALDSVAHMAAIKACASLAVQQDASGRAECLERGRKIHLEIGCHSNLKVKNTLIDMYAKCGSMVDAQRVFDSSQPDVASWSVLILGYAETGEGHFALELFSRMKSQGCVPNSITFMAVLKACSFVGALDFGRKVHAEITEFDAQTVSCLVNFYAKSGSMVEAQKVFDMHSKTRNLACWTALLAGYGSFGDTDAVFGLFRGMQDAGLQPDGVIFQCLLMCCSHAGLVEKARECFEAMAPKYGVTPNVEHYTCMVDALGRANKLDDAIMLLRRMPCSPDVMTWMTVLGACHKWRNVDIGRLAFQSLVSLDEKDAAAYVLMSHIYGSRGMWEEQETVLGMRKRSLAWKLPGKAYWTDEIGRVFKFVAGDTDHPQIQEKLQWLSQVMREQGHVAESLSRRSIHSDDQEAALCGHSETLSVLWALSRTAPGETIRVVKNLKICPDCHEKIAFLAKVEGRSIIVRDATRFHVFKSGLCSCGDC